MRPRHKNFDWKHEKVSDQDLSPALGATDHQLLCEECFQSTFGLMAQILDVNGGKEERYSRRTLSFKSPLSHLLLEDVMDALLAEGAMAASGHHRLLHLHACLHGPGCGGRVGTSLAPPPPLRSAHDASLGV